MYIGCYNKPGPSAESIIISDNSDIIIVDCDYDHLFALILRRRAALKLSVSVSTIDLQRVGT